jgi:hypothetical protein
MEYRRYRGFRVRQSVQSSPVLIFTELMKLTTSFGIQARWEDQDWGTISGLWEDIL